MLEFYSVLRAGHCTACPVSTTSRTYGRRAASSHRAPHGSRRARRPGRRSHRHAHRADSRQPRAAAAERSTSPASRCPIGKAMPTVAPAPAAPSARTRRASRRDPNYRTGWQDGVASAASVEARARRGSSTCAACATTCSHGAIRRRPSLLMLHGWMDVGASFQFLVDALARRLARGRARPARLRPVRVAAAGLLVPGLRRRPRRAGRASSRTAHRVRLVGHSLGGNIVMHYAGVRPRPRRARWSSLDGFGIPAETPDDAPRQAREVARRAARPAGVQALRESRRRRRSRCRRTIRGCRATRREFLARHWARAIAGRARRARVRSAPQDAVPDGVPDGGDLRRLAHRSPRRCCGSRPRSRTSRAGSIQRRPTDTTASTASARRLAHVPTGTLAIVQDAGHMLHHDQPDAVARAIEPFLRRR